MDDNTALQMQRAKEEGAKFAKSLDEQYTAQRAAVLATLQPALGPLGPVWTPVILTLLRWPASMIEAYFVPSILLAMEGHRDWTLDSVMPVIIDRVQRVAFSLDKLIEENAKQESTKKSSKIHKPAQPLWRP